MAVAAIDYTARDFNTIKAALIGHLQAKFPNTWKDFTESQMGIAWMELVCYTFDILSFYLDYQANECVVGETLIPLVDGTTVQIKDLVGKGEFWVYSYDRELNLIVPGRAMARKVKNNASLVEVEVDHDRKLVCTYDHLFMLRDGTYREAKDLKPGDSLMPLYRWVDKNNYELIYQPGLKRTEPTHRFFVQGDKLEVIHHRNFNSRDNRPENLLWMLFSDHYDLHSSVPKSKGWKKKASDRMKDKWRKIKSGEIPNTFNTPEARKKQSLAQIGLKRSFEIKERMSETLKTQWESGKRDRTRPDWVVEKMSLGSKGKPKPDGFGEKISRRLKGIPKSSEHKEKLRLANLGKKQTEESNQKRRETLKKTWANQHTCCKSDNHKVVNVKILDRIDSVYDLSVEKYNNYAVDSGFFIHNCFLPTARDRINVLNICKLVGYKMRTATSSSVVCKASITLAQAQDVIIPAGTTIVTPKGVTFRTLQDQRIPSGQTEADIEFSEGLAQVDTFSSDGTPFQKFALTVPGVIYGSISVTVDGATWTEEDSLVYGDGDSEIYSLEYDSDDVGYVLFGDNTNGKSPFPGAVIEVSYRTGGGIQGNIAIGEISTGVVGHLDGILPTVEVDVSVVNEERGSGGEDRETIGHAKLWAPRWVKTNSRAVTVEDFDTLANTFSDPVYGTFSFAKAALHQEIPEYNLVDIYVWGRDNAGNISTASNSLKNSLENYFNNNGVGAVRIICTDVDVIDGDVVYVDVDISIKVLSDYSSVTVSSSVNSAISTLFGTDEILPGEDFRISKVYEKAQSVLGIQYCLVNRLTASKIDTEIAGVGNGLEAYFSGTLLLDSGCPVVPRSVRIQHGSPSVDVLQDDGYGYILNGTSKVGTIDYNTGVFAFTTPTIPNEGSQVTIQYREILDYQRGELESVADGTTSRYQDSVNYAPIVPLKDSMKGIAFSDGIQVVVDDGDGNIVGDVDPLGINRIDYQTGAYDFTFRQAPPVGAEIWSTYRQLLKSSSEDLPLSDNQLPVEGLITVNIL